MSSLPYRGRIVSVEEEAVALPGGGVLAMERVVHPGGAAVAAVDGAGRVLLLRHWRPAVSAWLWELPAGKREGGEDPETTARRELAEEAGLAAGRWRDLGKVYSSPGVFTERVHLYLARDLRPVAAAPAADEVFTRQWLPLSEALAMVREGRLADAKTAVALCRAAALLDLE